MCSHGVGVNGVVPFPVSGVRFPLQAVMQLLQRFGACSGSAPDNFIAHQDSGTTTYDTLSMMQKVIRGRTLTNTKASRGQQNQVPSTEDTSITGT